MASIFSDIFRNIASGPMPSCEQADVMVLCQIDEGLDQQAYDVIKYRDEVTATVFVIRGEPKEFTKLESSFFTFANA